MKRIRNSKDDVKELCANVVRVFALAGCLFEVIKVKVFGVNDYF